jgi:hypothetical protein
MISIAEQAEQYSDLDIAFETPPAKEDGDPKHA